MRDHYLYVCIHPPAEIRLELRAHQDSHKPIKIIVLHAVIQSANQGIQAGLSTITLHSACKLTPALLSLQLSEVLGAAALGGFDHIVVHIDILPNVRVLVQENVSNIVSIFRRTKTYCFTLFSVLSPAEGVGLHMIKIEFDISCENYEFNWVWLGAWINRGMRITHYVHVGPWGGSPCLELEFPDEALLREFAQEYNPDEDFEEFLEAYRVK